MRFALSFSAAFFLSVLMLPFTGMCQNQYLQDWTFHTDSIDDAIFRYEMHLNDRAETFIAADEYFSDSIAVFKIDSAGTLLWERKHLIASGTSGYLSTTLIATDNDYNYYFSTQGKHLVKLDSSGNVVQNYVDTIKDYLHPLPLYGANSYLAEATDDYLYVIKRFYIVPSVCCFPQFLYLTKYDRQFNALWTRKLCTAHDVRSYLSKADSDENIHVILDTAWSAVTGYHSYRLSFKPNGDTLLYHPLEYGNSDFSFYDINPSVGALVAREINVSSFNNIHHIAVSRFDTSGIRLWTDTIFGGPVTSERATDVYLDNSGCSYLLSRLSSSTNNIYNFSGGFLLRKYDFAGSLIRTHVWSGTDTSQGLWNSSTNLKVIDDKLYILGCVSNVGKLSDAIVIKSDTSGNTLWTAQYAVGDSIRDAFFDLEQDICGNLYVTGRTDSGSGVMSYINLVRFVTEIPCYASTNEWPDSNPGSLLYPNPATTTVRIRRNASFTTSNFHVYDAMGRKVLFLQNKNNTFSEEDIVIDVSTLPGGIYLITDGNGFSEKFVLR